MALEEVFLFSFAVGGGIKIAMVAVFHFPHEEIAWVDLPVDSDLWVRHKKHNSIILIRINNKLISPSSNP